MTKYIISHMPTYTFVKHVHNDVSEGSYSIEHQSLHAFILVSSSEIYYKHTSQFDNSQDLTEISSLNEIQNLSTLVEIKNQVYITKQSFFLANDNFLLDI